MTARILAIFGMIAVAAFVAVAVQSAGPVGTAYADEDCEDEAEEDFDDGRIDEDELDEALEACEDDEDEDDEDDEDNDRFRIVQIVRQPIVPIPAPRPVAVASAPAPSPAPVVAPAPAPAVAPQLPRAGEGPMQQDSSNSTLPLGAGLLVVAGLGLAYWRLSRSR